MNKPNAVAPPIHRNFPMMPALIELLAEATFSAINSTRLLCKAKALHCLRCLKYGDEGKLPSLRSPELGSEGFVEGP
jgi:hypothetical protein